MSVVAYPILHLIHTLYSVFSFAYSCWKRLTFVAPLSLQATRRQIPKHLAVLFIPDPETHHDLTEKCLLESMYRAIDWCREVGIPTLTLYDEQGIVKSLAPILELHLDSFGPFEPPEDSVEYPPTPPLSDCASRSISPNDTENPSPFTVIHASLGAGRPAKNNRPFRKTNAPPLQAPTVYLVSSGASKSTIASVSTTLAKEEASYRIATKDDAPFSLTVNEMKWRLEGKTGLPAADFMIVHPLSPSKYNRTALELHGVPLFQIRLTEIYHNRLIKRHDAWINWLLPSRFNSRRLPFPLTEVAFREALDEYAGSEMRFGK